ncbi:hypothetical protein E2C01_028918 [Portunus trituberculatus]|uniref:Uncharacterized protein n=1 Tax=Portunus trituberculatus TaxID=210409 RepID=A0A5B7ET68_PORTR|nr:hypothetical protein [Portunus trituberculatus]
MATLNPASESPSGERTRNVPRWDCSFGGDPKMAFCLCQLRESEKKTVAPSEEAQPTLRPWTGFEPVRLETPHTPNHPWFHCTTAALAYIQTVRRKGCLFFLSFHLDTPTTVSSSASLPPYFSPLSSNTFPKTPVQGHLCPADIP